MRKLSCILPVFILALSITVLRAGDRTAIPTDPSAPCDFEVDFTFQDVSCNGFTDGQATINITVVDEFTGPYTIEWFDGDNRLSRDDLPAGTHFVKVSDTRGCFLNEFVDIEEPPALAVDLLVDNVKCFGEADGSIDLTVVGGTPPYTYQWTNGEDTEDVDVLIAGDYEVTVRDAVGCQIIGSATLTQPEDLGISPTVIPVSCNGGSDGQINTVTFGGVLPYRYLWSTGDTIPNVINLPAGEHTITVTDGNNCEEIMTITMPQPPPIRVEFEVTDLKCFESNTGEILAQVSGGTPGYQFEWSNSGFVLGDTTTNPTGLTSDFYAIRITDSNLCEHKDSTFVDQPSPLVVNLEPTPASCFNKPDGEVELTVSGGNEPYSILWSTGGREETAVELLSNEYEVVVADQKGCTGFGRIFVDQPDSLDFQFEIIEVSCKDQDDGSIILDPIGGTPDYDVVWFDGSMDFEINDLVGGTYPVTLTDANNCVYETEFVMPTNPRDCITRITIPNTFTPNGDDINDLWVIRNFEVYPAMQVRVFNKWGSTLFESVGYNEPWDGNFSGSEVQEGTYYYIVDLKNGDPPFTGTLTIIR
ncbi:MAG: gliding motility-associated C-terminal domain-containing protein [Bacteroidota bacterium]